MIRSGLEESPLHGAQEPLGPDEHEQEQGDRDRARSARSGASVPIWPSRTRRNPSRKNIHPNEAASEPVMLPRPPNTTMISGLKPAMKLKVLGLRKPM